MPTSSTSNSSVQAIDRAFLVLETVAKQESISLNNLHRELGLNKASLLRVATTLCNLSLIHIYSYFLHGFASFTTLPATADSMHSFMLPNTGCNPRIEKQYVSNLPELDIMVFVPRFLFRYSKMQPSL